MCSQMRLFIMPRSTIHFPDIRNYNWVKTREVRVVVTQGWANGPSRVKVHI